MSITQPLPFQEGGYTVQELLPGIYGIDTAGEESMYLVCGSEKALLIDTGSDPAPILPLIRKLTDRPVELALTHAHFDHMYHCDEFRTIYLHKADAEAWKRVLGPIVFVSTAGSGKKPKHYDVKNWHLLAGGDEICLGSRTLRVVEAKGHTPGSILLVSDADRCMFTGDAFGSGSFAWMWMPGCSCLSDYRKSLQAMCLELDVHPDYRLFGGHRIQGTRSPAYPEANPLTAAIAHDMITLCEKILAKELQPVKTERNFGLKTYMYRYRQAAIVIRRGNIR
ncbi:MAG: MBL fold metallo-hydrolase [Oscillospiraceae bacterium]|nr:MBL fold metallo-hydrolase [Oscillospiraceae bacterium]